MALDNVRDKLYYGRKDTSYRSIPGFSTRRVVKDMWHSNPFNCLVLKDMKVLQTPASQPLHCRLRRPIRLQRWRVEADLVKLQVTWFGFGFGWDVGMGWMEPQRLRWGQMSLELEGSAGFTRAQQIRLLCYWSKAKETSLKFIWGLRIQSSASQM